MPSDDEFRRVAEDVRALARSLRHDIGDAVSSARRDSRSTSSALRDELRAAANKSRQHLWGRPTDGDSPPWRGGHRPGAYRHGPHRHDGHGDESQTGRRPAETKAPRHPPAPRHPRPAPRHHRDGSTLLGVVSLVFGLCWLAAATHLMSVPWRAGLALVLLVLGAAMVFTARTDWSLSRKHWPVVLGAALVAALLLSGNSFAWPSFGQRSYELTSWLNTPSTLAGGVGTTSVDLSHLPVPPKHAMRTLVVHTDLGATDVTLGPSLCVHIDARVRAGAIRYNGRNLEAGLGSRAQLDVPSPGCRAEVDLVVRSTAGTINFNGPARSGGSS